MERAERERHSTPSSMVPLSETEERELDRAIAAAVSNITVPRYVPPTPEELARRKEVFDRILALREEIGPIGIPVWKLIRQDRDGEEADEEHRG